MRYHRIRPALLGLAAVVVPLLIMPSVPGEPGACPNAKAAPIELAVRGGGGGCIDTVGPESGAEKLAGLDQMASARLAPDRSAPAGALRMAIAQRAALSAAASSVPGAAGTWRAYGSGPLIANDSRYPSVNGEGLVDLNGRVDTLDYDPASKRLFAGLGTGGVWMSTDMGANWKSIGENLPTQVNGALAWTPAGGGALIVATGEPIQAYGARTGIGVLRTRDLGATWEHATGVPDGALSFQVVVDRKNPSIVYAATSKGLFRSENAGVSFKNVNLPTGECAGKTDNGRCMLANFVTDVVVQAPDTYGNAGGAVLAVVGYRAGARLYAGTDLPEGAWNGLYSSADGKPGSFTKIAPSGFTAANRIGKVELGIAEGPAQNHDIVYAIVEDAEMFRGGYQYLDAPTDLWTGLTNTVLNGVYVSKDFGQTWTLMGDSTTISQNPATGSALVGTGQAVFYAPGAQAWYNQWIKPDPTKQTAEGVPTRLLFGLEEVWENDVVNDNVGADKPTTFHVVGKYFANRFCLFLDTGLPACPTGRPPIVPTTTHPDQHEAIFVPDGSGGVTLVVGNDGGVYTQHADSAQDFENTRWGDGANDGFNTLLPYHARIAKDGTAWFGLQDNGSGKVDPADGKLYMTMGGDGFFVAVDPNNSDYAWSETPSGSMRVTTDGGQTWKDSAPVLTGAQFSNPFVMDPKDANHLMTAGREVVETIDGADTCDEGLIPNDIDPGLVVDPTVACEWKEVYNLGTKLHPGDADAEAGEGDADNVISAVDLYGDAAYVGFCGPCSIMNDDIGFGRGLATNVGGAVPAKRMTSDGWHIAGAKGLPNRMINSIAIDPADPRTVFVAVGGYDRGWRPPGSYRDKNKSIGRGHVFRSTDAGATFVDISGSLPNAPANAVTLRGSQVIVGTDVGAFLSSDRNGSSWAALDKGMPAVPVSSLQVHPGNSNQVLASTFGRGLYLYEFPASGAKKPTKVLGGKVSGDKLPATGVDDRAGLLVLLLAALLAVLTRRIVRTR